MKPVTVSRDADKFVIRMPDGMRERLSDYKKRHHISQNSAVIQGIESFLNHHEQLQNLLEGVGLLRERLEEQNKALELERSALAEMRAQLNPKVEVPGQNPES